MRPAGGADAGVEPRATSRSRRSIVAFGEIGLTGELRPVAYGEERLREAAKQGFTMALIPKDNAPRAPIEGLQVVAVDAHRRRA